MSAIKTIIENPLIKNVALGALKKAFGENKLSLISITLDSEGELQFDLHTEPVVVIKADDLKALISETEKIKKK